MWHGLDRLRWYGLLSRLYGLLRSNCRLSSCVIGEGEGIPYAAQNTLSVVRKMIESIYNTYDMYRLFPCMSLYTIYTL